MINIVTPRRHASARHRGATLLVALFASILPAGAQEAHAETPDPAIFDARYEEAFAAAVAMPDDTEPTDVLQAWGVAMMSAVMVDRARAIAELGENAPPPDGEAVNEQVLARWQQMRPESGGPDLFRALSIRDPATKRAAIIGLLDRYPDNVLVVSQALQQWLHAGEAARAVDVAETFLARNPDHPLAYGLLLQAMDSNETLLIDALRRWAQVAPGEPRLLVTFGWHLFGSTVANSTVASATANAWSSFHPRRRSLAWLLTGGVVLPRGGGAWKPGQWKYRKPCPRTTLSRAPCRCSRRCPRHRRSLHAELEAGWASPDRPHGVLLHARGLHPLPWSGSSSR